MRPAGWSGPLLVVLGVVLLAAAAWTTGSSALARLAWAAGAAAVVLLAGSAVLTAVREGRAEGLSPLDSLLRLWSSWR
ncbi:MAG: hypothetical protein GC157_10275 [Frankiales bacterium]|nr:hypothetical protein [Frankiales bacterium]